MVRWADSKADMKLLYYASYLLTAPFWALGWLFYGLSFVFDWIGSFIHDQTTYWIWLVIHNRNLKCRCRWCDRNDILESDMVVYSYKALMGLRTGVCTACINSDEAEAAYHKRMAKSL